MRLFRVRRMSFRVRFFFAGTLACSMMLLLFSISHSGYLSQRPTARSSVTFHVQRCGSSATLSQAPQGDQTYSKNRTLTDIDSRVLVLLSLSTSPLGIGVTEILESNRFPYQIVLINDKTSFPQLVAKEKGRFSSIVVESIKLYLSLDSWNRQVLDRYCRDFSVGIVIFNELEDSGFRSVGSFPLRVHTGITNLKDSHLNPSSPILRILKSGGVIEGFLPGNKWSVFVTSHRTFVPIAYASKSVALPKLKTGAASEETFVSMTYTTVLQDQGLLDGIRKVYFGGGFDLWLHKVLFLDALTYTSRGKLLISLNRYLLVDIDDIFVGKSGKRITKEDVQALISSQRKLQSRVEGFHFNLGYSGNMFRKGTSEEQEGDQALVDQAHHFWWFTHMWSHEQPHQHEHESIHNSLKKNLGFANEFRIPLNVSYAIAPHHSGVYPIHDPLYDSWNEHGIQVTSTEEYPHLRPDRKRRGFIYKNIKVLPRQTCGLFTHTFLLNSYPGGRQILESSIFGGSLFQLFINNQVNVFMTHMSNYGNDRLALYVFESVVNYLHCWTNLRLKTLPPLELAKVYFELYPEDKEPLWMDPCLDKRHLDIWSPAKSCTRLPTFLVVGPQKTGTTALHTFLRMHPDIRSNKQNAVSFEELQFFGKQNYKKGIDWYMKYFPDRGNNTRVQVFEKSANYFDSEKVPQQVQLLIPSAKIIVILSDPIKRAYSWYQHMRAHNDPTALSHSFYDVVLYNTSKNRALKTLRSRCLVPGLFGTHLERWLSYFPSSQILTIDGDKLKEEPTTVMINVQRFLGVKVYDYSNRLKFDKNKGFFCPVSDSGLKKCLGKGKGRSYPPMRGKPQRYLKRIYKDPNHKLAHVLRRIRQPLPGWLLKEIS